MKIQLSTLAVLIVFAYSVFAKEKTKITTAFSVVQQVSFEQVSIDDTFWNPRLKAHFDATLKTCIAHLQDSTPRIRNFEKAAGLKEGKMEGVSWDDSDVYKVMEGIAYSLIKNPNPEYEALLDRWIDLIAKAQEPDGYLNTYFTLNAPEQRWVDMGNSETYCGGHMIEAAVAHHRATGKDSFLNIAIRYANYVDSIFGTGKRHWVTGHEEVELALVKLYRETGNKKYLDLSHWLLEERGHGYGKGEMWTNPKYGAKQAQDDVPVAEIQGTTGHAVRAMYLYTGMADVAAEKNLPAYVAALERVWDVVVHRNMYITGGIGSAGHIEGFSTDYDLPNKEAYCETCASIGMVYWNYRMNLLSEDAKYADVMERSLYNGVLSGVSLKGNKFFYVNPLESDRNHHRQRWFGVPCCPTNISRLIPSLGNYIYASGGNGIFVNLYLGNQANMKVGDREVELTQTTNYPWSGQVQLEVNPKEKGRFAIHLRIPGWCKNYSLQVNSKKIKTPVTEKGYARIKRDWKPGDKINLDLSMPVELVAADPRVKADIGKRAIQRGPLVYCAEETDNKNLDLAIGKENLFKMVPATGILEGITLIETGSGSEKLTFVPYFSWDNREPGKMKVWMNTRDQ